MKAWMWWDGGEEALPSPLKLCVETARRHYDVEFIKDVPSEVMNLTEHVRVQTRADLIRLWKLAEEGGFWIDTDVIVLKAYPVEELIAQGHSFVGFSNGTGAFGFPNTMLAARPRDSFVTNVFTAAQNILKQDPTVHGWNVLGKALLSRFFRQYPDRFFRAPRYVAYTLHHKGTARFWTHRTDAGHAGCKDWNQRAYSYHVTNARTRPFNHMSREEILADDSFFSFLLRRALA